MIIKIEYSRTFKKQYAKLPLKIRNQFKQRQRVWLENQFSPVLNTHMLKGEYIGFYSFNVTGDIRALYEKIDDTYVIFGFIGSHSELYS